MKINNNNNVKIFSERNNIGYPMLLYCFTLLQLQEYNEIKKVALKI